MKYAYYFKSESMDSILLMSDTYYSNVFDFMKNEIPEEYEDWDDDSEPPYCDFKCVSDSNPIEVF